MNEQLVKKLQRQLAFTRIICMISSILTILLLVAGAYLFSQVRVILEDMQPILDQVEAVDVDNVNETLLQIRTSLENVDLEQVVETMEQAVETLNEVDIDALNSAISGLDTEERSETLANLNDAVEALQEVEDSINAVFGRR